jgi:orotate phosphoribosyltransferase
MDLLKKLGQIGAVYKDYHFVYKSGKHGPHYINPDDLLPYLPQIPDLGRTLASKFRHQVDVVLGPDFGGNYLALLTAVALGEEGDAVMWVATRKLSEEEGGGFIIEPDRGFERFLSGRRVLIVEDLLTTGSSVVQVRDVVAHHKANAVGISAVVNRGGVTAKVLGLPSLEAAVDVQFEAWDPGDCRLCKATFPIVEDIGHGGDYKQSHSGYRGGYIKLRS